MDPYWLGHEDGCKEGRRVGYDEGRKKGYDDGYYIGRQEGYETGRTDGYETGQSDGYSSGYSAGMESHRETFLARIYGFHEELIRERDCPGSLLEALWRITPYPENLSGFAGLGRWPG